MNGDFSRDSFDRRHRFSRVLLQQGRVLLDADWNEQTSILLHTIRTLAADLIGPAGTPTEQGFKVLCDDKELRCDFRIGYGHYYVDGILCENDPPARCGGKDQPRALQYSAQPDYPLGADEKDLKQPGKKDGKKDGYFVYLDVWERHLTWLQAPGIREVALGGPDTATRTQVVWQVKVLGEDCCENTDAWSCADWMKEVVKGTDLPRCLRARARVAEPSDDPCIIPPESRYRGAENQLYRVEIHDAGEAKAKGATFKWSRDNGSVVFAIRTLQGSLATLDSLGPDDQRTLVEGDWVEIVDDVSELRGRPGTLLRVDSVDRVKMQVKLAVPSGTTLPVFAQDAATHPLLRRWDQGSAALPVHAGKWIDLEDGVQVWFEPGGTYQTGDYWQVPARTATGDVIWPTERDADGTPGPQALPPLGIRHHYAPLGRISLDKDGVVSCESDCRCIFPPLCAATKAPPPQATAPDVSGVTANPAVTDTCDATKPVQFTAKVTGTPPLTHAWKFGDGATSSDPQPTHKYAVPGTFTVTLEVSNSAGKASGGTSVTVNRCTTTQPAPGGTNTATPGATPTTGTVTGGTVNTGTVTAGTAGTITRTEGSAVPVAEIANIGERRAKLLTDAGRTTAADVAAMSTGELAELLKVSPELAETIHSSAQEAAGKQ